MKNISTIKQVKVDKLREIVKESKFCKEAVLAIGLTTSGDNCKEFKKRLIKENIDFSHFEENIKKLRLEQCSKHKFVAQDIVPFLVENSTASRGHLRNRLIKEGFLKNQCSECQQRPEWNGKPLTLQLDHINGVNNDNRLENLRLLCPNCHSQTPTYGSLNRKIHYNCQDCGIIVGRKSTKCRSCSLKGNTSGMFSAGPRPHTRKVERPSKEELEKLIQEKSFIQIGKQFDVTDNSVRKWCKGYGIDTKVYGRGYWAKQYSSQK